MKKIILDTNFLLIPYQWKIDIFEEIGRICIFPYKLIVLDSTLKELKIIQEKQKRKAKEAAKLGSDLAKKKATIIKTTENELVDKTILRITKPDTHIVATQDIPLKKELKKKRIPIIQMRQKKYLIITNAHS